jgi:hypothetical protein
MANKTETEKKLKAALPNCPAVNSEYDRLMALFKKSPKNKLALARKLISRAAFLAVTIDELEKDITLNGYEDEYQNGANQSGKKKSAAAELHVTYTKNLLAVMKQLDDMLEGGASSGGDSFERF